MNAIDACLEEKFVLPRWHLLYSERNLSNFKNSSVFSKNNLLNVLSTSQTSARTLVKFIFLDKKKPATLKRKTTDFFDDDDKPVNSKRLRKAEPDRMFSVTLENNESKTSKSSFLKAFSQSKSVLGCNKEFEVVATQSLAMLGREPSNRSRFVEIFGPSLASKFIAEQPNSFSRGVHIPKCLRRAITVFQTILHRSKKHKIHYLFEVHCKTPQNRNYIQSTPISDEELKIEIKNCLLLYSSVNEVFLFLRSVIRQCFSTDSVWGSCANELAFFKNFKFFLSCCRFDKVTIHDFCRGISVSSIPWLKGPQAKQLCNKFLKWLLLDFVFEVITRFFYVTEHSKTGHRLYYYRKDVWVKVASAATELMVRKKIWTPVTSDSLSQFKVRFCPKHLGVRPIMKAINSDNEESNMSLFDILKFLQYICKKFPSILGCSVLNSNEIHSKWRKFWHSCRSRFVGSKQPNRLYFVKMDLDSCFDSIVVEMLLRILREILDRSCQVTVDHLFKGQFTKVCACSKNIFNTLERSLKHVHLDVYGTTFVKTRGIPQGWNLSSMLCNIFYGDLESKNLQEFMKPKDDLINLLMRFTDDYIFVSTSKVEAIKFISKMQDGYVNYGLKINWTKTCCNFSINDIELNSCADQIKVLNDDVAFSWFGLLFPTCVPHSRLMKVGRSEGNKNHGGVSIDLSRYSGVSDIRNSTTVHPSAPDYKMVNSLSRSLRLRVTTICFDIKVNSHVRVLRNVYELGVLTACKWLVHNLSKPKHLRLHCAGTMAMIVTRLALVFLTTMRKKLPEQKFPSRSLTLCIFFKAFYKKLARYAPCYDICIRLLKGIRQHKKKLSTQTNWKDFQCYMQFATAVYPKDLVKVTV